LLLQLDTAGIALSSEDRQQITVAGYAPNVQDINDLYEQYAHILDGRQHLWLTPEQAKRARERSENPQPKAESYMDRIPEDWKKEFANRLIGKEDWCPARPEEHTRDKEFRKFISSHVPRFDRILPYRMFYLYMEQCLRWLADEETWQDYEGEEQRQFVIQEFERIDENKLYGAIKYGYIKDDEVSGGWRKYDASAPQALLFWLMDCGFSGELGKGRQAAITSSMMLYDALTMLVRASYKGVLVTDDVEFTGKNIFADKLQACIQILVLKNPWLSPAKQPNWSAKKITHAWSVGRSKSEQRTFSSDYTLAASNETQTINGTTPSMVRFDECQNISTYQDIKLEARPTMLSNIDGIIRVKRQLWAWGTGSRKQTGNGAFENEYKGTLSQWKEGRDTSSFVPLFFDRTCRPGFTDKDYIREYEFYMNRQDDGMAGMTKDERMAVLFSAYPNKPEDMFLTSHKTIVPAMLISEQQERILAFCHNKNIPVRVRFEPIMNTSQPMPEGSWFPHKVIGAKYTVLAPDDQMAPCKMFLDRAERPWLRRYYQGTDPIQSSGGTSKFASAIWDRVGAVSNVDGQRILHPTVACILNDRTVRIEECWNQSILMGMYYANHGQRACMEVFEVNKGEAYQAWKETPQFNLTDTLWYRMALPAKYRGGQHTRGIDMKNNASHSRKSHLFLDIIRLVNEFGRNIYFYDYWTQMHNIEVNENNKTGAMEFGTMNKNKFNDDLVFAVQYAFMSSECEHEGPRELTTEVDEYHIIETMIRDPRTLQLVPVRRKEKIVYA
jgi:hypothetical protein